MGKGKNRSQWKHLSPKTQELKKCEGPGRCKYKNSDVVQHFDLQDPEQRRQAEKAQQAAQQKVYGNGSAVGTGRRKQDSSLLPDGDTVAVDNRTVTTADFDEDTVFTLSLKLKHRVAEVTLSEEIATTAATIDRLHEQVDEMNMSVQMRLHKDSSLISDGYLEKNGYRCLTDECSPGRKRELGDDVLYGRLSSRSQKAVRR